MKHVGLGLLFLALVPSARADDFYQGIRQMGMGGAAVAVVNDETSLLLNPIGLGRLRVPYITIIDPEITAAEGNMSTVQSLLLDSMDVGEVYNEQAKHPGERYFVRGQIFPSFADRNFGIGFLMKNEVTATRHAGTPAMDLNYKNDQALVAGYNHSFYGGQIKLGAGGRLIDRAGFSGALDPATQGLDPKNFANEGLGLAGDVGLSLTSPTVLLPTLSIMAKDIGDTSFTLGDGYRSYLHDSAPEKVKQAIDVAVAVFPIWSNITRGTFTVEYDDVLNTGDTVRKLHAGVEVNLGDMLFLRAGYNRGYMTGGLEWAAPFFQIQLAYYGEEVGTDANPIQENRWALKTVFRF
jgi:hypothetical protein